MSDAQKTEIWQRMYEEQIRHARHHELLRAQSTNVIVAISAALIAFVSTTSRSTEVGMAGWFVAIANLYGLLLSLKHYERSRLHLRVSSKYRDIISQETAINGHALNDVRKIARSKHQGRFRIQRLRAYYLWCGLHLLLGAVGMLIGIRVLLNF